MSKNPFLGYRRLSIVFSVLCAVTYAKNKVTKGYLFLYNT